MVLSDGCQLLGLYIIKPTAYEVSFPPWRVPAKIVDCLGSNPSSDRIVFPTSRALRSIQTRALRSIQTYTMGDGNFAEMSKNCQGRKVDEEEI